MACIDCALQALDIDAFRANGIEGIDGDAVGMLEKTISRLFVTSPSNIQDLQSQTRVADVFNPTHKSAKVALTRSCHTITDARLVDRSYTIASGCRIREEEEMVHGK